ncbi:MAG: multicopper oxidase domain-containing protein [Gloeocapsa sp. UFS-A4-WI-NPMV-4B04]|jgi:FtsP/CotA-like multicopper oxidase with cupredoxin domain|nr:multicopper oxidase domain-containing protein [Gloeocapsa sp. UFS-A4-WI-NPMV-4B04]
MFKILQVWAKLLLTILTVLVFTCNSPTFAQSITNSVKSGCEKSAIDIQKYGGAYFQNPEEIKSQSGVLETTLEVKYGQNTIAGCDVNLRSYNGKLVGPTLRMQPGDTIKINLINNLPQESNPPTSDNENRPRAFNTTNFHAHGLHVSPSGISDNVLHQMPPTQNLSDNPPEYPIQMTLPKNHPGGSSWYHAHFHGSTALQVSSGMAGALIVEGGLDRLPEIAAAKENIFIFQQIVYDEQGQIENYSDFRLGAWQRSKRHTTINGQLVPTIEIQPGEVQHWRFIHGGIREGISLELRHVDDNRIIKFHEIAVDGIPLGHIDDWEKIELEPGYRSDVLVKMNRLSPSSRSEEYVLVDAPNTPQTSLMGVGEAGQVLAKVVVKGQPLKMRLPNDDELAEVKKQEAPPDILAQEITGTQQVTFNLSCIPETCQSPTQVNFDINGREFNHNFTRELKLNHAEEWKLETIDTAPFFPAHPFHIHVNPFQHTRKGPNKKPETIWRDTLLVVKNQPQVIRTRYSDFIGKFALHCHILDHEDQGMMEFVELLDKDKKNNTLPKENANNV